MEFIVHKHSKEDFYPIFCKWLSGHSFPEINKDILPENVFVCYDDEVPIYCIWVYFTDSKLCWLAFPASNKNVNYKKKRGGLEFLLESVIKYCKRKKILTVITTSGTESIIEPLLKSGFTVGDEGVNHYLKKI
jgi:hypothetical protein